MEQCKAFIIMVGTANTSSTLSSVFLSLLPTAFLVKSEEPQQPPKLRWTAERSPPPSIFPPVMVLFACLPVNRRVLRKNSRSR